jgi:hypothetical protein
MPTLSHLTLNRATLVIDTDGGPLTITYRPGGITPKVYGAIRALAGQDTAHLSADEQAAMLATTTDVLAALLIAWDLTDDAGVPIPPTLDGLQSVPYDYQLFLVGKLAGEQTLGEANGARPSAASSTPTLPRARTKPASRRVRRSMPA